ncbi:MAG: hypothetical protein AUI33_13285 [Ignavibacteria bacterium 13_1_40CM_2_61_4]|nr:MAG: hypothetical protein AUI33_13285 [Ignavibacteria bacterium 13_1_40CM_2_61_4]
MSSARYPNMAATLSFIHMPSVWRSQSHTTSFVARPSNWNRSSLRRRLSSVRVRSDTSNATPIVPMIALSLERSGSMWTS